MTNSVDHEESLETLCGVLEMIGPAGFDQSVTQETRLVRMMKNSYADQNI
ncbi:MAG: hypothetical protein L0Z50_10715 [Verrucomicrobiales bacterium]|nr:hypothetical protein [Verrucomicrobiales bacterium]